MLSVVVFSVIKRCKGGFCCKLSLLCHKNCNTSEVFLQAHPNVYKSRQKRQNFAHKAGQDETEKVKIFTDENDNAKQFAPRLGVWYNVCTNQEECYVLG